MQTLLGRRLFIVAAMMLLAAMLFGSGTVAIAQTGAVKERSEISDNYKWDLTAMYKSDADWEAAADRLDSSIPKLKNFEGKISASPGELLAFFRDYEKVLQDLENAFVYASMAYDQDTRNQKYAGYQERMQVLLAQFGEAVSWFTPELVSIPDAKFAEWYRQTPELKVYTHYIDDALRTRKYTLSPAEERILAMSANVSRSPYSAHTSLCNTDLQFPTIKDENGNDVELSEGRMSSLLMSSNKDVRRSAALGMLETYGKFKNTSAALMSGNMAGDVFYSRARGYNSSLHASLDGDNVDTTVYLNLIATVKRHARVLQRYCDLRRRALGLDTLHLYDMSAVIIPDLDTKVPYDEAVATITKSLTAMGKEYVDPMTAGFKGGWVDVYENKGKQAGAYSTGSYLSHPYMLLNYNDTMDDMFTTTHEIGHCMHTWLSHKHQPYIYADYPLFSAEVASTFNEGMLMDHLLKKEKDPQKKLALVNQYIDNIRGTVIVQTMFADFELKMHRAVEAGEPLTAERLGQMYIETVHDYYGDAVAYDEAYEYTWSRIPHFYRNYYVYKYATAMCASQALLQKVQKGEKGATAKFIGFLSSGSSDYPIALLQKAGVDLTSPAPVEATMQKFSELVGEFEVLLAKTGKI
ncbi:oligoendopeptidase F [bacterium]|nr:oligoendopeptidase F [bacterium]MBU1983617.1 oligoendopeptidase F [bacterium]